MLRLWLITQAGIHPPTFVHCNGIVTSDQYEAGTNLYSFTN